MVSSSHAQRTGATRLSRRALCLYILLCLVPLLTGCSASSGEKQIFPICISMDGLPDGRLQLAVQVNGMADDPAGETAVFAAAGDSFAQTLEILGASMPYPLHFGQLRLCIISGQLAAQQDLFSLLSPLAGLATIDPHAAVMVCTGNAAETMAAQQPDLGVRLSTYLDQLLARLRQERLTPPETLHHIMGMLTTGYRDPLLGVCALGGGEASPRQTETGGEGKEDTGTQPAFASGGSIAIGEPPPAQPLPGDLTAGALPRKGGNPVEYIGCAMVGGGRVTGYLSAPETRQALYLRQDARISHVTQNDALVTISKQGKVTLEQALAIAGKWQSAGCDAAGVIAAAARQCKTEQEMQLFLNELDTSSIVLTITCK